MRLIDADELLTRIRLNYNNHQNVSASSIKDMIDTTKVAYEVDKVIERLKEFQNEMPVPAKKYLNGAIEIVRSGVNE